MKPVRYHTIAGVKHKVTTDLHLDGFVDIPHLRKNEEGEIYVDCFLGPEQFLETAIHEVLHIVNPNWSEDTVERAGREVRRFLWRLGYRRGK
jgi:hypothetical protein